MNTDATRAHIDAETLAAWADRALPADEAASVELHLSNCDRCQEVLAAFVRSAPMAGAVVIPFWARRPVQWSAAGLAAAAAVVAMIWIGRPPDGPTPESTVAYREATSPAPTAPAPATLDQLQAKPTAASPAPSEGRQDKRLAAADDKLQDRAVSRRAEESASPSLARTANEMAKKPAGRTAGPPPASAAAASPLPPVPVPVPQAAPPPPPVTVSAAAPVVTPPAAATVGGVSRPAAMYESVARDAITIAPVIEIAAPDPTALASRSAIGGAGRGGAGARELRQNLASARWRILAGTRVERTVDAGATWTPLPIEPPLTTLLVAGVATSELNCWLVGREGVVLVTHDGRTFRRVSVPEVVHLTGVTAEDGMRATVTAIDGRKFSTIDGGLTWK